MKWLSTLCMACWRLVCSIIIGFGIIGLVRPAWVDAQISFNDNATLTDIVNELQGPGLTISGLTITIGNNNQYGTFTGGTVANGAGPVVGIDTGVFLTSGAVNTTAANSLPGGSPGLHNATLGPNTAGGITFNHGVTFADSDLTSIASNATRDTMILEFDVIPQENFLKIAFVFSSDEYPEHVCTINDAFGFFITGDFGSGSSTRPKISPSSPARPFPWPSTPSIMARSAHNRPPATRPLVT